MFVRRELLEQLVAVAAAEGENYRLNHPIRSEENSYDIDKTEYLSLGNCIAVALHAQNEMVPVHGHNYVEIMYVCSGTIKHIIDGKTLIVRTGDVLFMNQHVRHAVEETFAEDLGINFVILPEFFDIPLSMIGDQKNNVLSEFLMSTLRIDDHRPQYILFRTAENEAVKNLFENMIISMVNNKEEENINQYTMGLIFMHLLNNLDSISSDSLLSGNDLLFDTAMRYINHQYQNANLTVLARSMHQSVSNMSRIIKNSTGHTFLELLQRKRFQQAVIFLEDTKMTIAEIMNAVGYENSSFFYRKFKERYGISPKKYRSTYALNKKKLP